MSEPKVFNFMGVRWIGTAFTCVLLLISIACIAVNQFRFGLDFTGGTLVELRYQDTADLEKIRADLAEGGYPSVVVTTFGTDRDVAIRVQTDDPKLGDSLIEVLRAASGDNVELKRVSFVGPQIGEELRDDGGLGILLSFIVVMIYVAVQFQFKFSVGAIASLVHDVIIVLGVFSLFQLEFDLTVLAAILAIIGYSLNDTIVVFDRIRENFRKIRTDDPKEVLNVSLTETFERTMITSLTTLFTLVVLFFVGGDAIHNFAIALIVGVLVGTYSSIYVAASLLLTMNISREDLLEVEKEGADQEEVLP